MTAGEVIVTSDRDDDSGSSSSSSSSSSGHDSSCDGDGPVEVPPPKASPADELLVREAVRVLFEAVRPETDFQQAQLIAEVGRRGQPAVSSAVIDTVLAGMSFENKLMTEGTTIILI